MQAYLINPLDMSVSSITYSGNYKDIYKHIEADLFDVVTTPDGMSVYVDDEGMFNSPFFFLYEGMPQPLAGKGLVLGPVDAEGDSTPCPLALEDVYRKVQFGSPRALMQIIQQKGWDNA